MSANSEPVISENVARAREALQRVRSLRESILAKGIDGIYDHFEDVDGDWLENWIEDAEDIVVDEATSNTVVQGAQQH